MKEEQHGIFDRIAVAFGATIVGGLTALIVALPLFFFFSMIVDADMSDIGKAMFLKAPLAFGVLCGVVAFFSPATAAELFGKAWSGALLVWRGFVGR